MDSKKLFTTAIATTLAATAVVTPAAFAADETGPTAEELSTAKGLIEGKSVTIDANKITDVATVLAAIKALDGVGTNTLTKDLAASAVVIKDGKATVTIAEGTVAIVTINVEPISAAKLLLDGKTILLTEEQYTAYKTTTATDDITADDITAAKAAVLAAVQKLDTATTDETKNTIITALADGKIVKATDGDKLTVTLKEASTEPVAAAVTATVTVATVSIENNNTSADIITVKGLAANDVVNVYDGDKATKAIGTAKATADGAKVSVKALDETKPLYIAVAPAATPKVEGVRFGGFTVGPVAQTERNFTAIATNKAGAKNDVVTVLGVKPGDIVTVYTKKIDKTDAAPEKYENSIGTAKVSKAGAVDVKFKEGFAADLTKDGEATLYVTVTELNKGESVAQTATLYSEKQSEGLDYIEASNLAGAKNDTITLYNVKAKDIIKIYKKGTEGTPGTPGTPAIPGVDENDPGTPATEGTPGTPATVADADLVQEIKVSKDAAALTVKVKSKEGFIPEVDKENNDALVDATWYYTRTSLDELPSDPIAFDVFSEEVTNGSDYYLTYSNNVKNRDTILVEGTFAAKDIVKVYEGDVSATVKPVASAAAKQPGPLLVTIKNHYEAGTVLNYVVGQTNKRDSYPLSVVTPLLEESEAVDYNTTLLNDNGAKDATLTIIETLPQAVYTVYDGTAEVGKAAAKGGILNITLKGKKYADLQNVSVTVTELDKAASQPALVMNLDGKPVMTVTGLKTILAAMKYRVAKKDDAVSLGESVLLPQEFFTVADSKVTSKFEKDATDATKLAEATEVKIGTEDVSTALALQKVASRTFTGDVSAVVTAVKALDSNNTALQAVTNDNVKLLPGIGRAEITVSGKKLTVEYVAPAPAPTEG